MMSHPHFVVVVVIVIAAANAAAFAVSRFPSKTYYSSFNVAPFLVDLRYLFRFANELAKKIQL